MSDTLLQVRWVELATGAAADIGDISGVLVEKAESTEELSHAVVLMVAMRVNELATAILSALGDAHDSPTGGGQ